MSVPTGGARDIARIAQTCIEGCSRMKLRILNKKLAPSTHVKVRAPVKRADEFYSSPEWRSLLDAIIKLRGRCCEDPAHDSTKSRSGKIYGDHVRELKDGGARLDPSNVLLRCASCHQAKTMIARAARYHRDPRGVGTNADTSQAYSLAPRHAQNF